MTTVNTTNPKLDGTVRLFDQFYEFALEVPVNEYDIVNSFFQSIFKTKEAAANFTMSLFRVAQQTQVPVLTLLNQIEGQNAMQITVSMAYFLNGIRSPSTLLGVNTALTPNFFAARNVLS